MNNLFKKPNEKNLSIKMLLKFSVSVQDWTKTNFLAVEFLKMNTESNQCIPMPLPNCPLKLKFLDIPLYLDCNKIEWVLACPIPTLPPNFIEIRRVFLGFFFAELCKQTNTEGWKLLMAVMIKQDLFYMLFNP